MGRHGSVSRGSPSHGQAHRRDCHEQQGRSAHELPRRELRDMQTRDARRTHPTHASDHLEHDAEAQDHPHQPCDERDGTQRKGAVVGRPQGSPDLPEGGHLARDQIEADPKEGCRHRDHDADQQDARGEADQAGAQSHRTTPSTARTVCASAWPVTVSFWMPMIDRNRVW